MSKVAFTWKQISAPIRFTDNPQNEVVDTLKKALKCSEHLRTHCLVFPGDRLYRRGKNRCPKCGARIKVKINLPKMGMFANTWWPWRRFWWPGLRSSMSGIMRKKRRCSYGREKNAS